MKTNSCKSEGGDHVPTGTSKKYVFMFHYVNIGIVSGSCSDITIDQWKIFIRWPLIQRHGVGKSLAYRFWKRLAHAQGSSMKKRDAMLNLLQQWQSTISIRCVWALPAPFHFCIPLLGRNLLLWVWMWASDRRAQGSDVWEGGGHSVTRANCLVISLWSHNLDWNRHIKTNANMTSTTAHHANNNNLFSFVILSYPHFKLFYVVSWRF